MLLSIPVNSQNINLLIVLCQDKFCSSLYFMGCDSLCCLLPLPFLSCQKIEELTVQPLCEWIKTF